MDSDIDIKRTLKNITDSCYKILELNLADDSYRVIKTISDESSEYYSLTRWVMEYAINDDIHPEDKINFIKFMNIHSLKKNFDKNDKPQRIYYRRKRNSEWAWVCLEVTKDFEYSPENPIAFLILRDVDDDYIRNMLKLRDRETKDEYDIETKFQNSLKYKLKINSLIKNFPCSVGLISIDIKDLIQGNKENYNEFIRTLRLLYKFEQIYRIEKSKFSIIIEDIDSEEFQLKLLQTYGLFFGSKLRNYIKITSAWTDEEEKGITDILRIVENKTYRINLEKENVY